MDYFNLEESIKQVKSSETQKLLNEVLSSYYNSNYRACIVTLYSATIYDMVAKLTKLKDLFNDKFATESLHKIDKIYKDNEGSSLSRSAITKYSDIEKEIMESFFLLGIVNEEEKLQIFSLKEARNKAAHPVLSKNDLNMGASYTLITPTREQTLAHLRNIFEGVLVKDIVVSKKILAQFREDVCAFYIRQSNSNIFNQYVEDKFYKYLSENAKISIFNEFWKYAFCFSGDADCDNNRQAIITTIFLFMNKNVELLRKYIEENSDALFASIKLDNKLDNVSYYFYWTSITASLSHFFYEFPEIYKLVPEHIKIDFTTYCSKNINVYFYSCFLSTNLKEHLEKTKNKLGYCSSPCLEKELVHSMYTLFLSNGLGHEYREFITYYFTNNVYSSMYGLDFDYINRVYKDILGPILPDYIEEELKKLLDNISGKAAYSQSHVFSDLKRESKNLIDEKHMCIDLDAIL